MNITTKFKIQIKKKLAKKNVNQNYNVCINSSLQNKSKYINTQ